MLSGGVILLPDNTHTARKTQELLQKFKWEVWSHPHTAQIWLTIWIPNTYLEQGVSSDSDAKTAAENWINEKGRDFYTAG
ncbi:hypothetical protein AVEN_141954-1 [Araneus ventricosus]|uniref:Mariner Mos1 transposase n=1 Tax=Araneus ventricosus TaxID=182803 RepID=A0A4Y2MBC9_ARAVE|nr:hypothetical protein AVEN_141954-1 [Araneus ventricosus]